MDLADIARDDKARDSRNLSTEYYRMLHIVECATVNRIEDLRFSSFKCKPEDRHAPMYFLVHEVCIEPNSESTIFAALYCESVIHSSSPLKF